MLTDGRGSWFSAIGSPIGKIPGRRARSVPSWTGLRRVRGHGPRSSATTIVRVFSFLHPARGTAGAVPGPQVIDRMAAPGRDRRRAGPGAGARETKKEIFGDTPGRCADLIHLGELPPRLRATFDAAETSSSAASGRFSEGLRACSGRTLVLPAGQGTPLAATGEVVPAGQGDGQMREKPSPRCGIRAFRRASCRWNRTWPGRGRYGGFSADPRGFTLAGPVA